MAKRKINWQHVAERQIHPLRLACLRHIAENGKSSPSNIHQDIGDKLGNVSYHVRALVDAGLIELVETKPRRGAVEHFYSLTS